MTPRNAMPLQEDTLRSLLAMLNWPDVVKIGLMVGVLKDLLILSNPEVKVKFRVGKGKAMQAAKQRGGGQILTGKTKGEKSHDFLYTMTLSELITL